MIKNDFEKWNQDDWLAKEIARESRISAWDLDEGKNLKREHERDCEARDVAREHYENHLGRKNASQKGIQGRLSPWFFIDLAFLVILIMMNAFLPRPSYFPVAFLFLALNPGIFIWLFLLRRTPSKAYLITVLIIALVLQLFMSVGGDFRSLRFLLWRLFR